MEKEHCLAGKTAKGKKKSGWKQPGKRVVLIRGKKAV